MKDGYPNFSNLALQFAALPPLFGTVHPVARDHPRRRPQPLLPRCRHRHRPLRLHRVRVESC